MYALFFVYANVLSIKNKFFFAFFAILPKINILVMRKILQFFLYNILWQGRRAKKWTTDSCQLSIFIIDYHLRLHVHAAVHLEYLARDVG